MTLVLWIDSGQFGRDNKVIPCSKIDVIRFVNTKQQWVSSVYLNTL